ELVIPDTAIFGPGRGAKFGPPVVGLQQLHLLAAVRDEAVLKIDAGKRSRKLAKIGRGRADEAAKLSERPVRRRNGPLFVGDHQRESLGAVAPRLDTDRLAVDDARGCAVGAGANDIMEIDEREEALVVGTR